MTDNTFWILFWLICAATCDGPNGTDLVDRIAEYRECAAVTANNDVLIAQACGLIIDGQIVHISNAPASKHTVPTLIVHGLPESEWSPQ